MTALLRPHFAHRQNEDCSFDSICTRCFATIASAENESELTSNESIHRCDPERLIGQAKAASQLGYRWNSFINPLSVTAERSVAHSDPTSEKGRWESVTGIQYDI